jgi:hypothetical protein
MTAKNMSPKKTSSRRNFLKKGALLAVPLAAAPAAVMADDGLKSRLAKLENEAAIRDLHQTWLRHINTGAADEANALFADRESAVFDPTVRRISADHSGEPDAIEVAPDGKSAAGRFQCAVETETPIVQDSTLAQMAHLQGNGFIRRTERRVLSIEYVKASGTWAIAKAKFASA